MNRELLIAERHKYFDFIGLVFMIWALVSYYWGDFFAGLTVPETIVLACIISVAGFTGGVGVASLVFLARIVYRTGVFSVEVAPHPFGILSTGRMLTKCFLVGAVAWMIITFSADWHAQSSWTTITFIAIPNAVLIASCFVWCQLPIHRRMVDFKKHRVYALQEHISNLRSHLENKPTEDQMKEAEYLERRLEKVLQLPEWPFGWKSLTTVVISWLGSTVAPMVLQIAINTSLEP